MDAAIHILFWTSLGLLAYAYLGYGFLAWVLVLFKGKRPSPADLTDTELPALTLVVTAYQESAALRDKLENIRQLDYPADKLKILLVVDEPDAESLQILNELSSDQKLVSPQRHGKYAAICAAMEKANTPFVVFSDANCQLNPGALRKMVRHFTDATVGGVAGEKKIIYKDHGSGLGQAEGWYWEYESMMKKGDADLYTVVGAAGELFSIRSSLFEPVNKPVILDDLLISLQLCTNGYRIAYEPGAFASEWPSASIQEEEKRKIRIAAGAFQTLQLLKGRLHPFKYPLFYFQFLSRRLFRWFVGPVFLLLLLFSNSWLVASGNYDGFFGIFLILQLLGYMAGLIGWIWIRSGRKAGLAGIPFYFLFMNYCLIRGFFRFLVGKQPVTWEKARRQSS